MRRYQNVSECIELFRNVLINKVWKKRDEDPGMIESISVIEL